MTWNQAQLAVRSPVHVRAGISNELKKVGPAHAPEDLPG